MLGQPAHLRHHRRVKGPPAQAFDQSSLAGIFAKSPKHIRIISWLIAVPHHDEPLDHHDKPVHHHDQ
jgi:hypothetical protein